MSMTFYNARLIEPGTGFDGLGGIRVAEGCVLESGPHLGTKPANGVGVDCAGLALLPGLVDMRVQLGEPGREHREDFASASRAALKGGVTRMVMLPNCLPVIDTPTMVAAIAERARRGGLVHIHCYGAATKELAGWEMVEIGLMREAGALGFTDAERGIADAAVMRRLLSYGRVHDALILQYPEEPALAEGGAMNAGTLATRLGLPGTPAYAEAMLIERDLHFIRASGCRYHAGPLSSAAALAVIRRAKAEGLPVSCDTAPPYFILTEEAVGAYRTFAKLKPPLRAESDRAAIRDAILDGTIDCIASNHTPVDPESKRVPFIQAEAGIVGLETLLGLSLTVAKDDPARLMAVLRALTCNPARVLGLDAGRLVPGAPADFILVDMEARMHVDSSGFASKSRNSPFDGQIMRGRVAATYIAGERKDDSETQ
ncbi:MAG TPA: dihydroorotase [Dongiaceae bacterium]|nr:dihydroorotase [Dongiaceae bacterium]